MSGELQLGRAPDVRVATGEVVDPRGWPRWRPRPPTVSALRDAAAYAAACRTFAAYLRSNAVAAHRRNH